MVRGWLPFNRSLPEDRSCRRYHPLPLLSLATWPRAEVGRLRTDAEKDEAAWSEGGFLSIGACPRTAAVVAWRGWLPFKRGPTVAWAFEREVRRPDVYEGCEGEDGPFKVISNFFAADVLSVAVGSWAEAS